MKTKYGVPFGNQTTSENTVFVFPDFELTYMQQIELTEDEKKRKQKSLAEGIDGGDTMLAPACRFRINSQQGIIRQEIDLAMVPYARQSFEINKTKFVLENSLSADGRWKIERTK